SFTLGCHFTDQHVVGTHFGADVHNAGIVQTVQLNFGQVADIAGDILRSQLRVTGNNRQLFDVNRSVAIVSHDLLGDQNRVLEVVAVPGHEGDQHVLTQSQFAQVSRCAVSQHVTTSHDIATFDDRTLVDVGVLVGTGVLGHVVDIYTDLASHVLIIVHANNHALCVNVYNHTATTGLYGGTRVNSNSTFDTGTDQRLLRAQARNCLTLHVGAHQCSVGVIVLQERNQRSSHRHDLRRSHVHVMDVLWRSHHGFASFTAGNQIVSKGTVFGQLGVSLSDDVIAFFNSRQVIDLFTDLAVNNLAVRRFQETVLVQTSVQRHGVDQTNVWTFRRFNRAHATVVGWVHVAHLKASTFTSQTTRAQCRNTTLVRDLGQRVGLVHKLRQLAGTEELLDSRRDGLGVDQIVRHQV